MPEDLKEKVEEQIKIRSEGQVPEEKVETPKSSTLIEGANAAAERLEKANLKTEELINRLEEVSASRLLSGKADAGTPIRKTQEDLDQEKADAMIKKFNPFAE